MKRALLCSVAIVLLSAGLAMAQSRCSCGGGGCAVDNSAAYCGVDPSCEAPEPVACREPCRPMRRLFDRCCLPEIDSVYVIAEATFLELNGPHNQVLVQRSRVGTTLLTTNDINYGFEAGPRLTAGVRMCGPASFEFIYFGSNNWQRNRDVVGSANLDMTDPLGAATHDFTSASLITIHSQAQLHSAESNMLYEVGESGFHMLGGFRYINLGEQFDIHSVVGSQASDYHVDASNKIYGGQLGLVYRCQGMHLGIDAFGKAGVGGNDLRQRTLLGDVNNTQILRNSLTTGQHTVFFGEIGLNGTVAISDCCTLRGGYTVMWIDGVARAADQLDFATNNASGQLLNVNTAFIHGATAGVEFRW